MAHVEFGPDGAKHGADHRTPANARTHVRSSHPLFPPSSLSPPLRTPFVDRIIFVRTYVPCSSVYLGPANTRRAIIFPSDNKFNAGVLSSTRFCRRARFCSAGKCHSFERGMKRDARFLWTIIARLILMSMNGGIQREIFKFRHRHQRQQSSF